MTVSHRAVAPLHNLSMDRVGAEVWPLSRFKSGHAHNLRSKGRAGRCAEGLNLGHGVPLRKASALTEMPAEFRTATLRRAESLTYGQLRRTGQAPGRAANFLSIWLMRLGLVGRVTRSTTRRTAVKLGGGSNLRSLTSKGSVTRYERFGASPKALRFTLDRRADFLEAIC